MGGNDHFPIRDRPMGVTNDQVRSHPRTMFLSGSLGDFATLNWPTFDHLIWPTPGN